MTAIVLPALASAPGTIRTPSEESIAAWGEHVLVATNHGAGPGRPGFAYSANGGQAFIDVGAPPTPAGWTWRSDAVITVNEKSGTFYLCGVVDLAASTSGIGVVPATVSGATLSWGTPVLARSGSTRRTSMEQPWLVADSTTGLLYLTCTSYGGREDDRIDFLRSSDGGATWTRAIPLSPASRKSRVRGSRLAVGPAGEIYATWTAFGSEPEDHIRLRKSTDRGASWSAQVTPAPYHATSRAGGPGSDREGGTTFPAITVDRTTGRNRGRVHMAWTEFSTRHDPTFDTLGTVERGRDSHDVFASHSDDGTTWSSPVRVNDVPSKSGEAQPEIVVGADGIPYVTWFDFRDDGVGGKPRRYLSRSSDGGGSWAANRPFPDDRWKGSRFDSRFDLTACQGDIAADPGSSLNPGWTVSDPKPFFANAYGWTLTSRRNWPLGSVGATSSAADGKANINPTIAIPDTAAPGVNRMCMTVTDVKGIRSRQCCFDLTVQREPASVPILASTFDLNATAAGPEANRTRIDFSLPYAGPVRLSIHGLRGDVVRTLADGVRPAGPNSVTWDGRNERGGPAGAGAYFCRLEGFGNVRVQRLIWLK